MTMTSKFISTGDRIPHTPGSALNAGDVVVIGSIVAVTTEDIAADALGSVQVTGVVRFPKSTASTSALTAGTKVYWDAENEIVTTTSGSNKVAGYVAEAAAASASTVDVLLARA